MDDQFNKLDIEWFRDNGFVDEYSAQFKNNIDLMKLSRAVFNEGWKRAQVQTQSPLSASSDSTAVLRDEEINKIISILKGSHKSEYEGDYINEDSNWGPAVGGAVKAAKAHNKEIKKMVKRLAELLKVTTETSTPNDAKKEES